MNQTYDRILHSTFQQERCGLVWVESRDRNEETGESWPFWLLVEKATDRALVTIDGPTPSQITYQVCLENGSRRLYISLEGAKRNALACAMQILRDEKRDSAGRRKLRHARQ